jgi:hypothetical protein
MLQPNLQISDKVKSVFQQQLYDFMTLWLYKSNHQLIALKLFWCNLLQCLVKCN